MPTLQAHPLTSPTRSMSSSTFSSSSACENPRLQKMKKSTKSSPQAPPLLLVGSPKTQTQTQALLPTPPESAVGTTQYTTGTTQTSTAGSSVDCPISQASFLLAQASLATALFGGPVTTEFLFHTQASPHSPHTLRFGDGLDGCFSRTRGFLTGHQQPGNHATASKSDLNVAAGPAASGDRLPASLEAWEDVQVSLPRLLRAGRVRRAVDALGTTPQGAWADLEQRHLARAALVLSALAHAYMFGEEQPLGKEEEDHPQVPSHVLCAWDRVCKDLGRPVTGRVPADDVLNNAAGNASFALASTYFALPEERLSAGLQGTMEAVFAPALSAMALAQNGVLADQPDLVAHCLESLAARIVECALVFQAMTPRDTARFDPVIWIKTYPAMGRPVTSGELGNSGVDAPLFHALDAFIGRQAVKGDLRSMQSDRRATLPANIRAFLDALGDPAVSVKDYVAAARARHHYQPGHPQDRHLSAAWDGLLQLYVWFLERHRVKAVGITGVSLNTGRHSTSSGVTSGDQAKGAAANTKMRPETMLSMQMKAGMASRLAGRPLWQDAHVQSRSVYQNTVVVAVRLDVRLPLEPGDRVQVWPPKKRKTGNSQHGSSSNESDDNAEPRFYSIARVRMGDVADGSTESRLGATRGMTITLTVGQHSPEGLVSSFLGNAAQGTHLRLRPWPCPSFRQPRNMAVPLVLVGQGSGVGPLVGFLHDRARRAQPLDHHEADENQAGEVLLFIAAKTRRHIPCSLESLEHLSRTTPLTIVLALSQDAHIMIRCGTWTTLPQDGRRVARHLLEHRDLVQRLVKEKGGHIFVCGSSDFADMAMSSLGFHQPQQQQQSPAQDTSEEPGDTNRAHVPSPAEHWSQLHLDVFAPVARRPSASLSSARSCFSSPPEDPASTIISASTLAAHNSMTSCWTAINGTVYDMTSFLTKHPGGPKTLLESAGTMADARFAETHGGPHAQEIMGHLRGLEVGLLSTATATQTSTTRLLGALVRLQNALTNNTAFAQGRGPVPMYVYADALLVFADGLDGVVGTLSDSGCQSHLSALRESLGSTQSLLKEGFAVLRDGCKGLLLAAGSGSSETLLEDSEDLVRRLYMAPIGKVHATIDDCKKAIGEVGSGNADDDQNTPVLQCILQTFCSSLARIAEGLLY